MCFIRNCSKITKPYIAVKYKITILEWNNESDHIHILFKAHPKTELSKFINAYKSASSRLLKQEYPSIKDKLWQEAFWTKSFCLISCGNVSLDTIKKYINEQGSEV
jgi:putative transposase